MSSHKPTNRVLAKSSVHSLSWEFSSVILQAVLQIIVLAVLSRLLSPEDFGLVGIAMIFVGFADIFAQMGVGPAIIQRTEITDNHIRVGFTATIFLGLLTVVVLWVIAPLAGIFFNNQDVVNVLRGISFSFLFTSLGAISQSLLTREMQFHKLMLTNIGSYLSGYIIVGIVFAWLGYGVWALVLAKLAQSLIRSLLMYLMCRHSLRPSFEKKELQELLYFGGGFTLVRMFNYLANQGDYLIVARYAGADALGIYTRAYQLMLLPATYFGQVLQRVSFPVMSKIKSDLIQLKRIYFLIISAISIIIPPVSVILVVLSPEIVRVILGNQWGEVIMPFQILTLGILFRTSYKIDDSLAKALGAVYRRSVRDAIYATVVIVGSFIGLRWGLPGVAVCVLCAVILNYLMAVNMSLQLLDSSWGDVFQILIPGFATGCVTLLLIWPITIFLRTMLLPDLVVMLFSLIFALLGLTIVIWLKPQLLGTQGAFAFSLVYRAIPSRWMPPVIYRRLDMKINSLDLKG